MTPIQQAHFAVALRQAGLSADWMRAAERVGDGVYSLKRSDPFGRGMVPVLSSSAIRITSYVGTVSDCGAHHAWSRWRLDCMSRHWRAGRTAQCYGKASYHRSLSAGLVELVKHAEAMGDRPPGVE